MTDPPFEGDVRRIASDPDALEAFYRRYFEAVKRFVARRIDDPHLVADLIADVFLAAIDSAHTYRPGRGRPGRWLYGVARNVVGAERRRRARDQRMARKISGRALIDDQDLAELVERIDAERRARYLHAAMQVLTEQDRDLVELVGVDGVAVHEAARILGVSAGAARVRLHRARKLLRDRLGQPAYAAQPPGFAVVKEVSS
jgi:RNA polymerase sigma-70 factor, ECF subfamily